MDREICVYAQWHGFENPRLMGTLRVIQSRGKETYAFEYHKAWLEGGYSHLLDPDLAFFSGPQFLRGNQPNFGMFLDSSPDRWGKVLMRRREAEIARQEGRAPSRLGESDYLLGVHDEQRMGAIRFATEEGGPFLADHAEMAAPPWASLRELEQASWNLQDQNYGGTEVVAWLDLLIAPGSSLGGARPKAGVKTPNGDLWIAKFPGRNDDHDIGAWEWVVWQLASDAGITVAKAETLELTPRGHHTFAVQRFDRVPGSSGKRRLHFASAMTLLGYYEGSDEVADASYLELVDLISNHGSNVATDLEELWRRLVFSICVSNTDDHLRNHGFILTDRGWKLSPAYDINSDPDGLGLSLNINETENSLSLELAMEVAPYFRLDQGRAEEVLNRVRTSVSSWRDVAKAKGIPRGSIEMMAPAFACVD